MAIGGPGWAQTRAPVPADELEVRLIPDLVLTVSMAGVSYLLEKNKQIWAGDVSCTDVEMTAAPRGEVSSEPEPCNPEGINHLDRWALDVYWDPAAGLSDIFLIVSLVGPVAFAASDAAVERQSPGTERFGKDFLVVSQTYAATYLVTNLLKVMVRRLRPFNYREGFDEERLDGDSRVSFPSGHSALAFAGAAVMFTLLEQRYPGEPWAAAVGGGAFAIAASVAMLRVLAGRHFPTDVLAGAAIGTSLGLLIPRFHRGTGPASLSSGTSSAVLASWGGRF